MKYDHRHWLGSVFLVVANKHSPLFPIFASDMSSAVLKIVEGERERANLHFSALKMSAEEISRLTMKNFKQLGVMLEAPAPERIIRDVCTVFGSYVDLDDPSRGAGVKFL